MNQTVNGDEQYVILEDIQQRIQRNFNVRLSVHQIGNIIDQQYLIGNELKKKKIPYRIKYIGTFGLLHTNVAKEKVLKVIKESTTLRFDKETFVELYKKELALLPDEKYVNSNLVKSNKDTKVLWD